MVYSVKSKKVNSYGRVSADGMNVPSTVEEISSSRQDDGITVLDLSDPKDVAMFLEAGFELKSPPTSSQSSVDSNSSLDSVSLDMEEMPNFEMSSLTKADGPHMVKRELKTLIQAKRLQSGKDLMPFCDVPKKVCRNEQLTPEEEEKRRLRREKNKLAAQKCRGKRQARVEQLERESQILVTRNETLKEQIEKLQAEKEMLDNMVRTHDRCPRSCNTCLSTSSEEEVGVESQNEVLDPNELNVEVEFVIDSSDSLLSFGVPIMEEVTDEPLLLE